MVLNAPALLISPFLIFFCIFLFPYISPSFLPIPTFISLFAVFFFLSFSLFLIASFCVCLLFVSFFCLLYFMTFLHLFFHFSILVHPDHYTPRRLNQCRGREAGDEKDIKGPHRVSYCVSRQEVCDDSLS